MAPTSTKVVKIESTEGIKVLLDDIVSMPKQNPHLFVDLEGVKLSRHGSVSWILIYLPPGSKIYMVDIHTLGSSAFNTLNRRMWTLKTVLESREIPKVLFDVRNDSDALFSHYGISLGGVIDLQLMGVASRQGRKEFVSGLAKCIEKDLNMPPGERAKWQATKDAGHRLFDPKNGGRYEVFNERPMKAELV